MRAYSLFGYGTAVSGEFRILDIIFGVRLAVNRSLVNRSVSVGWSGQGWRARQPSLFAPPFRQ